MGALALVLTGVTILRDGESAGHVVLGAVTMDTRVTIDATVGSIVVGADPPEDFPQEVVPIDVTLKNTGGSPVTVTEIRGEVLYFSEFDDCAGFGGGPAELTASYSLKVPVAFDDGTGYVTLVEKSLVKKIDFTVDAASVDRMEITFGPDQQQISFVKPNVMAIRIGLALDNGSVLDVGTVAGVTQASDVKHMKENESMFSRDSECNRDNLGKLGDIDRIATVKSPLLADMRAIYARYS